MKKILILLCASALAVSASAEVAALYWMVGDTSPVENYEYAKVGVVPSGSDVTSSSKTYLDSYYDAGNVSLLAKGEGPTYADISAYSTGSYSFFVELFNYEGGTLVSVGHGDYYSYTQLLDSGYISTGGLSPTMATATFTGGNYIPEPTSGLLLLFGGALLALRRRRA